MVGFGWQVKVAVGDGLHARHVDRACRLPCFAVERPVEADVRVSIVIVQELALHFDVGEVLGVHLGLEVVTAHFFPVDCCSGHRLVAALALRALVKPCLCVAFVVDEDELGSIVVAGAVEVGHTTVVARQIEVPSYDVVDAREVGDDFLVLVHRQLHLVAGLAIAPVVEGQNGVAVGGQCHYRALFVHVLAVEDLGSRVGLHLISVGSAFHTVFQLVRVDCLEVGGQFGVGRYCVVERRLVRYFGTRSVGPVDELIAEILRRSEFQFGAFVEFFAHRIDVHGAAKLWVGLGFERVLRYSLGRTAHDAVNVNVADAPLLGRRQAFLFDHEGEALVRGQLSGDVEYEFGCVFRI